jgi:hypothetical protein
MTQNSRGYWCAAALLLGAGCAQNPTPKSEVEQQPRIAGPIKPGDCAEARRRASLEPDLDVDQIPAPIAMKPAPFRNPPSSVFRKDGSAEIKIDVLIDTLGKADLTTFKVVKVSNKWFTQSVRGVIGKWTFTPAMLAGCRVPRIYHFMSAVASRANDSP